MIDFGFLLRRNAKVRPVVIVLRGVPSAGKTTVARELKKILPNTFVVSVDRVIDALISEDLKGKDRLNAWKGMWTLGHDLSLVIVSYFLRRGTNLVIEEMLTDKNRVAKIVNQTNALGARPFVFELTAPLEVIRKRERLRSDRVIGKPVNELIEAISKGQYPGAKSINTSKFMPEEVAKIIFEEIKDAR